MKEFYHKLAHLTAEHMGTPGIFFTALLIIGLWAITGPFFHFSDTWQLLINTGTTIITFLMVFLIQYAQNRDNKTLQLKLDELIKSIRNAKNEMIDLERLTDEQLASLESQYKKMASKSI